MPARGTVSRRNLIFGAGAIGAAAAIGVSVKSAEAVRPTHTTPGASFATAPVATGAAKVFVHPGMLHSAVDIDRVRAKITAGDKVVTAGLRRLTGNGRSQATWQPRPTETVSRGGAGQNYAHFFKDVHAAYQNALRWRVTGDTAHAKTAATILNAWSSTLAEVNGNADRFLAAGLYGYQLANAAELMRGYADFDLARLQKLLKDVFYPMNDDFLVRHNDACITNYWANWDLCNLASVMSIGILCDERELFDRAVTYLRSGEGNGSIPHAIPFLHGELGQWQESGRDQGHSLMGIGLMGAVFEMAWNQGVDLYGFDDKRFLKGAEYVARYNLGHDVPFTAYKWGTGQNCAPREQTAISGIARGNIRPVWELVNNHYVNRQGLSAPNVSAMAESVRSEGGGGDYGTSSGGYDQLGFGTLMYHSDKQASPSATETPSVTETPSATGTPNRRRRHRRPQHDD